MRPKSDRQRVESSRVQSRRGIFDLAIAFAMRIQAYGRSGRDSGSTNTRIRTIPIVPASGCAEMRCFDCAWYFASEANGSTKIKQRVQSTYVHTRSASSRPRYVLVYWYGSSESLFLLHSVRRCGGGGREGPVVAGMVFFRVVWMN
jgi:hypothetical protein